MKNNIKSLSFLSLIFVSYCVNAAGYSGQANDLQGVYTLGLGPIWASQSLTQTIYLKPNVFKTYDAHNMSSPGIGGELFAGLQRNFNRCGAQLGIAVAAINQLQLKGDIWEDANLDFNNYNYTYDIKYARVAVKGKFLTPIFPKWLGYISGSAGLGVVGAQNFTISPKIYEEVSAPEFSNNSTSSFTYTLGLGLQSPLSENWQVGIGYEFANLGKSVLGRAAGQTLNAGIVLNHIYAHQLLFSISYLCNNSNSGYRGGDYGNIWY